MIINSLTLHNFMSYADARLDLTSVEVACLTGLNGAGKSALLDAITWVLWEAARASSDELVRLGQSEMWVDLCFTLEDQVYRIRRSRQKSFARGGQQTGSKGNLDLQIWNGSEESWLESLVNKNGNGDGNGNGEDNARSNWISLTCSSMRETQKRLKERLRMDYETFITSVYLRQGKADEFSTRSPNERKQVFADILGLDYFDRLQDMCREEARECKGRIQILEANLTERSEVEETFNEYNTEISSLTTHLQELRDELEQCALNYDEIESQIASLNYLQIRRETAESRFSELRADSESLGLRANELRERQNKLARLVDQTDLIAEQVRQFEESKIAAEALDNKAGKHSELSSRRLELRSSLAMLQGRMEVELEHMKAGFETKLARKKTLAKDCSNLAKIESSYNEYKLLLEAELDMSRKRELFASLTSRADSLGSMIAEARVRLEAEHQQKEALIVELDQLLNAREQIEVEHNSLKLELSTIDQCEIEFELIEEKGIKVKSNIESLQQQVLQLRKYVRQNEERVHELCESPDLSTCPLCRSTIVDSRAVLDRYDQDNRSALSDASNIENQISKLSDERDALRKQYIELRKKLEQRKNLDRRIGEFNERKAAIERAGATRDEIKRELDLSKMKLKKHMFAPIEKESLIRVKAELAKLEFDPIVFSSFQSQMRSQRYIEVRYQQLQRDLKELNELSAELITMETRIATLESDLSNRNFGPEEKSEIESLDESLAELGYNKVAHQELKRALVELLPYAEKARDIERALQELPEIQRACSETTKMAMARQQELERLEAESQEWSRKLQEFPKLKMDLEQTSKQKQSIEQQKSELEKRKLLLETKLEQMQGQKLDLDTKTKLLSENMKEMGEYNQLAEAFGKKGIQAIIIENAIPEIEAEANRILARLTDNQMHLALLTQQQTRQGNVIETLDIIIADDLGTRSYELYSGGEAFRVNFALRVAMSRLLARRAGARLETLIIDEGFGSQDEQSRTKMIQAIAAIKPDFARIIVVTHIAEVKDMFPIQISVHKTAGVSKVAILA